MPEDPFVGHIISSQIGRARDEVVFSNGQSGGVATALLIHLFETGQIQAAIVAVMREDTPPRGDVLVATSPADLLRAQKSKYSPIPLLKAMREISGIQGGVALTGLPCHMHGLINLLELLQESRRQRFFKIGLVCDRVMTAAAIDFLGDKASSSKPIKNLVWRDKRRPSYPGNPVVTTASGEEILLSATLRLAIKDFFTPVRCRLCFDKLNIFADVVLGDPHCIKEVDRLHGETLVLVRTVKGQNLIDSAKISGAVALQKTPLEAALKGQGTAKKRSEWAGYMQAWRELGNAIPAYPFSISVPSKTNRPKRQLLHGLKLDEYQSGSELTQAAKMWLAKQKAWRLARKPFALVSCGLRALKKVSDDCDC
jgi:coenzyme F420 hydrogenase subunit beta